MTNNTNAEKTNGTPKNGSNVPAVQTTAEISPGFDSTKGFEALQRIAKLFCTSSLVPRDFQGERNFGNTVIALDMALRMKANPLMVFQNLYVVSGKPAWSSPFLIATFNKSGRFSALRYQFEGKPSTDDWGCRAIATELSTGEKLVGTLVTIGIAKREGWYGKGGSKWQTMPEQMLRYRAATWFIRSFAPEIAMGLYSEDELRDSIGGPDPATSSARQAVTAEDINAVLRQTSEPIVQKAEVIRPRPGQGRMPTSSSEQAGGPSSPQTPPQGEAVEEAEFSEAPSSGNGNSVDPVRMSQTLTDRCERSNVNRDAVLTAYYDRHPEASLEEAIADLVSDADEFDTCVSATL